MLRAAAEVLARGEQYEDEFRIRRRSDGRILWLASKGRVIRDEVGHARRMVGVNFDITARKLAEDELRRSEERFRLAASSEALTLFEQDNDLRYTWVYPNHPEFPEGNIGRTDRELLPAEEGESLEAVKRQVLETGAGVRREVRVTLPDGTRWYDLVVEPRRDREGAVVGVAGVALDVTSRKEAEELLRERNETVETINRVGPMLSAELDLEKVVQAVTDAATELVGARFGSFFYNVMDERGASYMLYTLSGVPREHFARFPMPRATDLFGPTFRGEGTILIADVKQDPRYGKNSPYFGMPKEHLPVASYLAVPVISRSGGVIGGLFFGHPDAGMFAERDARVVEGLAAQAAVAMDNARLYEEAQKERGKAEAAARENERLYLEAQEANRLKDEFLATVSHELRTPLTAILGWARMLLTNAVGDDGQRRALETIDRNARSQAQIIEDLLDISRVITGKLRLDIRQVEPGEVVRAAVDSVRPAAEAKNVRLQVLLDPQAGPVSGDADRLQQVVWNLLTNAVKFTPKGGRVQVKLERVNSHVEIAVSDTGLGIAPEFLPFVFDRFRQADGSTTRRHGGLGLGLSIVRQLVELHGGTIKAESPGAGEGASFTVSLPLAIVHSASGSGKIDEERVHPKVSGRITFECPPALENLRVLVVDDEEDARELLTLVLTQCKAEVLAVATVAEALAALEQLQPDVVVSDIGMPEADGFELIRRVRQLPREHGGRVPAVALTAYARVEDRMRALAAGYQMHVPKPVEPAELVTVIASLAGWGKG